MPVFKEEYITPRMGVQTFVQCVRISILFFSVENLINDEIRGSG